MCFLPIKSRLVDVAAKIDPSCYRRLDNMRARSFAVSGTRKTATVVSALSWTVFFSLNEVCNTTGKKKFAKFYLEKKLKKTPLFFGIARTEESCKYSSAIRLPSTKLQARIIMLNTLWTVLGEHHNQINGPCDPRFLTKSLPTYHIYYRI